MEKLIKYKYILDNYPFRVPKEGTKDEYSTSFNDFDITFSFKNKLINEESAKIIVSFLKKLRDPKGKIKEIVINIADDEK